MKLLKQSKQALELAIKTIDKGGVVICPTDTVYGFLADATNKKAVAKIYKIKKRVKSKPLPVFVKNFSMAKDLALIDKNQEKIIKKYWPGKYTFILKTKIKKPNTKNKLHGIDKKTLALRMPDYKFLNNLLKRTDKPLVQTSANISGELPLIKISDVIEKFNKYDILIIDGGNLKTKKSSKIVDLTGIHLTRLR